MVGRLGVEENLQGGHYVQGYYYNRYICVSIIYIRVTVGDMLHIGYISVRSRGMA